MILADKIMEERKKLGLSQEELADKLSVSRQSISKWESAQSIPDLQKIIAMSELFSVTTDYLLKDEIAPNNQPMNDNDFSKATRRVSMEEANSFLQVTINQSKFVALGVLLCIFSPMTLIILLAFANDSLSGITEIIACAIGITCLFLLVSVAVFLFIRYAGKMEPFQYLQKEKIETAYGVRGLVKEKKERFESTYIKLLSLGILLCVLSPLPLIVSSLIYESDFFVLLMTALLLFMVAIGVYMIVRVAMIKSGYQILLQEGDYTETEKKKNVVLEPISGVYWMIVTAIYLAWSFIANNWYITWIVWPISGVLFGAFSAIVKLFISRKG